MNLAAPAWPVPARLEMILPSLEIGGMERVAAALARELVPLGWTTAFTCTKRAGTIGEQLATQGVEVQLVPAPGLRSMVHAPALVNHLRQQAPDVVMTYSGVWLRGARAARSAGVPCVVHAIHGLFSPEPLFGPLEKWLAARLTSQVVAVSPGLKDYLLRAVRLRPEQVKVIANGVPVGRAGGGEPREAIRRSVGASSTSIVLGCVARLDPVKNLPALLHAANALVMEGHDVHVLLVGDGPERDALRELVATLCLIDRVHFAGAVPDPERWYHAFDIFVLPSLNEAAPMSLLEAMSAGCCVVATRVGANSEILNGEGVGVLVPPGDTQALIQELRNLVGDPEARLRYGHAARQRAVERYSVTQMALAYDAWLRPLLLRDRATGRTAA